MKCTLNGYVWATTGYRLAKLRLRKNDGNIPSPASIINGIELLVTGFPKYFHATPTTADGRPIFERKGDSIGLMESTFEYFDQLTTEVLSIEATTAEKAAAARAVFMERLDKDLLSIDHKSCYAITELPHILDGIATSVLFSYARVTNWLKTQLPAGWTQFPKATELDRRGLLDFVNRWDQGLIRPKDSDEGFVPDKEIIDEVENRDSNNAYEDPFEAYGNGNLPSFEDNILELELVEYDKLYPLFQNLSEWLEIYLITSDGDLTALDEAIARRVENAKDFAKRNADDRFVGVKAA